MIEYLKRVIISNDENGTQTTRLPNNEEIMNKMNEIITEVNKMKQSRRSELLKPQFGSRKMI